MRVRRLRGSSQSGLTLLELILTCSILLLLSTLALPIARYSMIREKEATLRHNLDEIRDAIDRYKDAADHNQIKVEMGTEGYPPDLETLVNGVPLGTDSDKKIHFLRKIPIDLHGDGDGRNEILRLVTGGKTESEDAFAPPNS